MKAAVWYGRQDVRVMDVPEPPSPGKGRVKIKVHYCGICGSDLHEYHAGPIFIPVDAPHPLTGRKAPLTLGHEFSGDIVEVGPEVTEWKIGDRVVADACQVCGECDRCKEGKYNLCEKFAFTGLMADGAFAEYVDVPAYTLYKMPDSMTYETGALMEPLAVGVHAVRRSVHEGDTVAILGAGTIGLVTLMAARAAGARKIYTIEIAKARQEFAAKAGANEVLDPTKMDVVARVKELTGGGADVVFECIGNEKTGPLAVELARTAGRIMIVGIFSKPSEFHFNSLSFTEKEVVGSLAYNGEFGAAIDLVSDGKIDVEPLVTGKINLENIVEQGFEELLNRAAQNIKILVKLS